MVRRATSLVPAGYKGPMQQRMSIAVTNRSVQAGKQEGCITYLLQDLGSRQIANDAHGARGACVRYVLLLFTRFRGSVVALCGFVLAAPPSTNLI